MDATGSVYAAATAVFGTVFWLIARWRRRRRLSPPEQTTQAATSGLSHSWSTTMKTSAAGRAAITQREGNKLTAYKDSVGVVTIGVGHTSAAGAPKVALGMTITAEESDEILSRDLEKFERVVDDAIRAPMAQHEFDAFVSLAFNIGGTAFLGSSVARRFNAGDKAGAAEAFLLWNKAGGKVISGLTTRRKAERKQFLGE